MLFNALKLNRRHLYGIRNYSSQSNAQHLQKSLSSDTIRNMFLDYFTAKQNHRFIRSSPVVPHCDATVPFVNAGMNQFKNIFLDNVQAPCRTAVNSQKCIRVGGKHNDLNVVGTDGYHHTFFEMLGNWSFGDYFKERACKMAWDLLTNEYNIHPSRLYVTYFCGNDELGFGADIECKEIWRQIGVPDDRILPFGAKDNFWDMGASGPCGPCTEIHIDHLPNSSPATRAHYVNAGRPDLTELWNLVFIQYMRNIDGSMTPLKNKHIDTGMGFERLVAILQDKSSNYDTDLFLPIFDAVAKEARVTPYSGTFVHSHPNYELDVAYRVLADHARMCTICIADGMFPELNHRLRRVFRKTIDIADNVFKTPNILEKAIIPQIVQSLGTTYPELERNYEQIVKVISHEAGEYRSLSAKFLASTAKNFRKLNLRNGSPLTEIDALENPGLTNALNYIDELVKSNRMLDSLSSEKLFHMHITFGLDEETLEKVAREKQLDVQMDEFAEYRKDQKALSRQALASCDKSYVQELKRSRIPRTDDRFKFHYKYNADMKCYELPTLEAKVLHIGKDDATDLCHIVLDKTNFYAMAGGQDSDVGEFKAIGKDSTAVFSVEMVEMNNDVVVHSGRFLDAANVIKVGDSVILCVNSDRRTSLTQHHTGVHLLQAAIRHITNKIIYSKSSAVSMESLKFDIGIIGTRLTTAEIVQIEDFIREIIQKDVEVKTDIISAHELYGCDRITTVPGVVYPDHGIKILRIEDTSSDFLSLEPCCGTHVKSTSELENFYITSIRRSKTYELTAVCGRRAQIVYENGQKMMRTMAELRAKSKTDLTVAELNALLTTIKQLKSDSNKNSAAVPFITKESSLNELESLDKRVTIKMREALKKWITIEMDGVISKCATQEEPLVAHVINSDTPLEFTSMRNAADITKQYPTILFNVANGVVRSARASIPVEQTSERFNAKIWLEKIFNAVGIDVAANKCETKKDWSVCEHPSMNENVDASNLGRIQKEAKSIFDSLCERRAQHVHESGETMMRTIADLRAKLDTELTEGEINALFATIKQLQEDLRNNVIAVPIATKKSLLNELAALNKTVTIKQREAIRNWLTPEMNDVISECASQEKPLVVHFIDSATTLEYIVIRIATDMIEEYPTILLNVSNGIVRSARSSIPIKQISERFNAKIWLEDTLNAAGIDVAGIDAAGTECRTRNDCSVCDYTSMNEKVDASDLGRIKKEAKLIFEKNTCS